MNPILHDLHNKQWVWTAATAKQDNPSAKLTSGFDSLDKVLSGGFPQAGMIHLQSTLGCGEMRLMLAVIKHQQHTHKLYVFINPPFDLNAEFLLAQNLSLEHVIIIRPKKVDDILWSAEQCAKSGACVAVFVWQNKIRHTQVRKLEHAAQQGNCYCVWLDSQLVDVPSSSQNSSYNKHNKVQHTTQTDSKHTNLPLSLSMSLRRENDVLSVKVNKQKVGWAQAAVKIPLPFMSHTNRLFKATYQQTHKGDNSNVVSLHANN